MSIEKVTYEFPDPDKEGADIHIEVEGKKEPEAKKAKPVEEDIDVEIVDDTPPKDRNRKASEPPADVTDEELEEYSEKVRKRLKHFSKGYNDQRREKEAALREKEEALRLAQQLVEENKTLKGTVGKNQEILLEQAKRVVATELEQAKAKYKEAYESGDADAVVNAQEEMTSVKLRAERVNNFTLPTLQEGEKEVQHQYTAPAPTADEKALNWQRENSWFGSDDEMTSFALGLHQKLVKQGVDPRSDEYYEKINARVRKVFPEEFSLDEANEEPEVEKPRQRSNVVAPATRSTAPRKIVLTQTQVAIAKRLGVPLELYAQKVAEEMRK